MKKFLVCMLLVLAGCGERTVTGVVNGNDGRDGNNGHSIVSSYNESSEIECQNGGSRLDLYVDMDDSLSASEGDLYQGSLVACNGANGLAGLPGAPGADGQDGQDGQDGEDGLPGAPGPQGIAGAVGPQGPAGATGAQGPVGPQGPQGPAGTPGAQGPAGSGATIVLYTSTSCTSLGNGFYGKSNSNTYSIYDDNDCHSSDKVADLNDNDDTYWLTSNRLAVFSSPNDLRVINFN